MPVRKVQRNGETRLLIDIQYRKRDGSRARLRKDAEVQTLDAAIAEDAQYAQNIVRFGKPYAPPSTPNHIPNDADHDSASNTDAKRTFAEVVDEFREAFMITDLKITSRIGYESVLQANLLPRFGHLPIDKVDGKAAADLDLVLTKRRRSRSTRNNAQIVLRSVLRYVASREYIGDAPKNLPRLKTVGQGIREIPTDEQVDRILAIANDAHRLTFTLMSDAGLRPNEVRALRIKDVQIKWENGEAIGGFITVREGRSHGEFTRPRRDNAKFRFPADWRKSWDPSFAMVYVMTTWPFAKAASRGANRASTLPSRARVNAHVSKAFPCIAFAITRLPRGCARAFPCMSCSEWPDTQTSRPRNVTCTP